MVIGKLADIQPDAIGEGERTLLDHLPQQGSDEANWTQNERVLLNEMASGNPIRDASVNGATGELENNTGFLAREPAVLTRAGWTNNAGTHLWSPGGGG